MNFAAVAVARDVLSKLGTEIRPTIGLYLDRPLDNGPCFACALGALAYSYLENPDVARIYRTEVLQILDEVFTREELDEIEFAYELSCFFSPDDSDRERQIVSWSHQYPSDEDRMRAIMENIIENDGHFLPAMEDSLVAV